MAKKNRYAAKFSDRNLTRTTERTYEYAYLLECPSRHEDRPNVIITGFAADRQKAEAAARAAYAAVASHEYLPGQNGRDIWVGPKHSAARQLTALWKAKNPIVRLELVKVETL